MYMRNCWYAAAWSRDIEPGKPFARTICEEPVVIFKTETGRLVALEDRCVHRRAPLSLGRIKGEFIECGYHGLQYDCSGMCVRIPGQQDIPERASVRAYPLADKWRWLWIWMGDPEKADESLIPDVHWNDSPGWVSPGETLHMNGHYQLLIDNLLDLSHLTFLHESTIGTSKVAEAAMGFTAVAVGGREVWVGVDGGVEGEDGGGGVAGEGELQAVGVLAFSFAVPTAAGDEEERRDQNQDR